MPNRGDKYEKAMLLSTLPHPKQNRTDSYVASHASHLNLFFDLPKQLMNHYTGQLFSKVGVLNHFVELAPRPDF